MSLVAVPTGGRASMRSTAGWTITTMACAAVTGGAVVILEPTLEVLVVIAIAAVLLGMLAVSLVWRRDSFEPPALFAAVWLVMFVVRPLAMLERGDMTLRNSFEVGAYLGDALVAALIGALAYAVGYYAPFRGSLAAHLPSVPASVSRSTAATIGVGAAAVSVAAIARSFGSPLAGETAYLYYVPLLAVPASLILLASASPRSSWRGQLVLTAPMVIFLASFFTIGQRAFFMIGLSSIAVYYYLEADRRPSIRTLLLVGVAGFIGVLWFLEVYRGSALRPLEILADFELVGSMEQFFLGPSTEMLPALAHQIQTSGGASDVHPGYTLWVLFTHWIPSAVWPDKPLSSAELLYAQSFPGHYAVSKANTQFSILGDFFYDCGYAGVLVGMYALGVVTRTVYDWIKLNRRNRWGSAICAPLPSLFVILLRGDLALTSGIALFLLGPTVLACFLGSFLQRQHPTGTREVTFGVRARG